MNAEDQFVSVAALLCEPTRARMLWSLLDGRAYTAGELALAADISTTSASNHLSKLLEADILKVELQGRHRYYSFSGPEVAYVTEAMANLVNHKKEKPGQVSVSSGIKFCRTCYDHLAGFVSTRIMEAMVQKKYFVKDKAGFLVTGKGWKWLSDFGIDKNDLNSNRRPVTRQCLDWSERKPHLAGQLGAALLEKMFQRKWFRKVQFSRELILTPKGRQELHHMLGISL